MASTRTRWSNLEKFETGAVDWGAAEGLRMDDVDLGIAGGMFVATAREQIDAYTLAGWDPNYPGKVAWARVKKTSGKTRLPAIGMAIDGTGYAGTAIRLLRRGMYEYAGWNWTTGARLYLGPDNGTIVTESDDGVLGWETNEDQYTWQRVGVAASPTMVMFDMIPHCRVSNHLITSPLFNTGDFTAEYPSTIGGVTTAVYKLVNTSATARWNVTLPINFQRFPGITGWGLRFWYAATSGTPTDTSITVYDHLGVSATLTATAGYVSSTLAAHEISSAQLRSSGLTFVGGRTFHVAVAIASASQTIKFMPHLECRFFPNEGGFEP